MENKYAIVHMKEEEIEFQKMLLNDGTITQRKYNSMVSKITKYFDQQELSFMSNEITNAIIEERLELLGFDHPLVDQIEERISEFADGYCDHEELMQMNNQITNAIKKLKR